jgi:hypothetical protein
LSSFLTIRKNGSGFLSRFLRFLFDFRSLFYRKLLTFLLFVFISTGFWIVRSLSEQYDTDVYYPVKYTNFPADKVLINALPQKLELRIHANGFSILKSKLNLNLIPLRFDVNSFALNSLGNDTFYIITETVKDLLSDELDQVRIINIRPDTLFFRFTNIETRKVPVRPVLALHEKFFQKQFTQNGEISVIPDSITISGPANLISKINEVQTEPLMFTNLTDSTSQSCKIVASDMISYSVQKVQVNIPVDRFTEVEERLSVQPVNVPDSLNMIAIPGQVRVTYRICLSNYQKITHNPLSPRINYRDISTQQTGRLTVFLADTPQIVSNVRFNPHETEFLITRK